MLTFPPRPRQLAAGRRFVYRPTVEAVEPRTLMATGGPLIVATLGDSLTDEYSFYGPLPVSSSASMIPLPANIYTIGRNSARNWDLNLAATRSTEVSFGAYTTADQGETRDQGFAQNWARSGATAAGFNIGGSGTTFPQEYLGYPNEFASVTSVEQPGLLTQSNASDVDVVTILIGANDYLRGFTDYAESLGRIDVFTPTVPNGLNAVNAAVENAINEAVTQIQNTLPTARIVLITTPDITITPAVQLVLQKFGAFVPNLGGLVSASTAQLTTDLAAFATSKGLGLVNFQTLYQTFAANPVVGGVTVNLASAGQSLTDGFIGDGFHPGTLVQGILAQTIVGQIDALYGSNIVTPLTDADILSYALATTPIIAFTSNSATGPATTVNLQAVITAGPGSQTPPTGTVTFAYYTLATTTSPALPGAILGTLPLNGSGVASLNIPLSAFSAGTIIATYNGDQYNTVQIATIAPPSLGAFPSDPALLFTLPIATTVELTPTYAKSHGRATVTLTVIVTGADGGLVGSPTGTVALGVGPYRQRYVAVVNGQATVTYPLSRLRGQFLAAAYSGDAQFAASGSQFRRIDPHPFRPRAIDNIQSQTLGTVLASARHRLRTR